MIADIVTILVLSLAFFALLFRILDAEEGERMKYGFALVGLTFPLLPMAFNSLFAFVFIPLSAPLVIFLSSFLKLQSIAILINSLVYAVLFAVVGYLLEKAQKNNFFGLFAVLVTVLVIIGHICLIVFMPPL